MNHSLTPGQQAAVAAAVDEEALAADTLAFIEVVSETGEEGEGSRFLEQLLRREGFEVEVDEFLPGRPNVYARAWREPAAAAPSPSTATPTRFPWGTATARDATAAGSSAAAPRT